MLFKCFQNFGFFLFLRLCIHRKKHYFCQKSEATFQIKNPLKSFLTRMNGCCGNKRRVGDVVLDKPAATPRSETGCEKQLSTYSLSHSHVILSHISHPHISHSHISHSDLRQVVKSNFPRTLFLSFSLSHIIQSHISHPLISRWRLSQIDPVYQQD